MGRSIVVLLLLLAARGALAASILVMGDSLSAGYGIEQAQAWPTLLDKKLKSEGYRYDVVNASISGETTAGGRSRIGAALDRAKPSVVIIELGANDGLRGLSLKAMRDNLDAMIRASQDVGARIVLVGMQMPPNFGQAYTQKFRDTFTDLSKQYKTALVPFLLDGFAQKRELFQADGLHPVAQAQPMVLDNVWPALKPLLKK
ncbi:arylesterase [Uliginosibacterium sp. sgz301328]|uniref:arylesterase n=1 Tax=Uliginosibacterium sp. sgz301328 TaxID=3243764 RepID=UPI00359EF6E4